MADWDLTMSGAGVDAFIEESEQIALRAQDVRPVLNGDAHDLHNEQMRRIFMSEGGESLNGKWRPLSPNSQPGPGILRQTGDLMRSYSERGHSAHYWEADKLSLVAGSYHRLARIHEVGGGRIPRRSALKREDMHVEFDDLVWQYVLTGEGT